MFSSLGKLMTNLTDIAWSPVAIALDITAAIVEPIAEGTRELVAEIKEITSGD